jgi:hypothetical protein
MYVIDLIRYVRISIYAARRGIFIHDIMNFRFEQRIFLGYRHINATIKGSNESGFNFEFDVGVLGFELFTNFFSAKSAFADFLLIFHLRASR